MLSCGQQTPMRTDMSLALAQAHPILAQLHQQRLGSLLGEDAIKVYRAGRRVQIAGKPATHAHFLLHGKVRAYQKVHKGEVALRLLRAPAFFGELAMLPDLHYRVNVATITEATILHISAPVFRELLDENQAFLKAITHDLAIRLSLTADTLSTLTFEDILTRLSALLLDYENHFGVPHERGHLLDTSLSQQQLARDVGASRKSLMRALAQLAHDNIVKKIGRRYVILDKAALVALAGQAQAITYSLIR